MQQALAANNITFPAGSIEEGRQKLSVRSVGEFSNLKEMEDIVVSNRDKDSAQPGQDRGGHVYLRDIATVSYGLKDQDSKLRYNGQEAISISAIKSSDSNTVEVVDNVYKVVEEINQELPTGAKLTIVNDNASFIKDAVDAVLEDSVLAILICGLVMLVFLHTIRSTFIVLLAIPTSIIFTFLVRWMLGLTAGRGAVAGHDIVTESELIKASIGYMSQRFSLYEDLTVEENIAFFGGIYGVEGERLAARRDWILGMAGLGGRAGSLARELSVGWKQRLALGCAVVHEPRILFLDEPTSGVDPLSRRAFWELIYTVAGEGVTVFVTTHVMDEAEHCDRLGMIDGGRLVALGSPRRLKEEYACGLLLVAEFGEERAFAGVNTQRHFQAVAAQVFK